MKWTRTKARGTPARATRTATRAIVPGVKGGYFPVPPVDAQQDIRTAMSLACEELGLKFEVHHHEVRRRGQGEINVAANTLTKKADEVQILKYALQNVANGYGKTLTFMPKPIVGDNGNGMHASIAAEGRQGAVRRRQVRRPVGYRALLYRRHHQACPRHQRLHQRQHQQLQAPGAGLRSTGEARLFGAQPLCVHSHPLDPQSEGPPHRSAVSGRDRESVLRLRGHAARGPRRHPETRSTPASRRTRISTIWSPKRTRRYRRYATRSTWRSTIWTRTGGFLKAGGVFTDDLIDAYIDLKMKDVTRLRMTTHPIELEMYYSL